MVWGAPTAPCSPPAPAKTPMYGVNARAVLKSPVPSASRALLGRFLTQIPMFASSLKPLLPLKPFSEQPTGQRRGIPSRPRPPTPRPVTPRPRLQAGLRRGSARIPADAPPNGKKRAASRAAAASPARYRQEGQEPLPRGPPPGPERRNLSGHILEAAAAGPGMRPGEPGSAQRGPRGPSRRPSIPVRPAERRQGGGAGQAKLPAGPGRKRRQRAGSGAGGGTGGGGRRDARARALPTVNGAGTAGPPPPRGPASPARCHTHP